MAGLKSSDLLMLNQALLELHSIQTAEEFPFRIYEAMRMVIGGDIGVVDWVNPRTSVSIACDFFPSEHVPREINALAHALLPTQSPFWLNCADEPMAISDRVSRSEWEKRDMFWALQAVAQKDVLCLDLPISPTLTLMLANVRGSYGTFQPEDKLKLKFVGLHAQQVYRRLISQGQISTPDQKTLRFSKVDVASTLSKSEWPEDARTLLKDYGVTIIAGLLPDTIEDWFQAQRRELEDPSEISAGISPLRLERKGRVLTIYLMKHSQGKGYWLLLEEKEGGANPNNVFSGLDLTLRESEVLFWVAQGKSNSEVAIILGISSGTVGRHLENIFPKLGVESRYAAGQMAANVLSSVAAAEAFGTK